MTSGYRASDVKLRPCWNGQMFKKSNNLQKCHGFIFNVELFWDKHYMSDVIGLFCVSVL